MPRRLLGHDVELEIVILESDVLGHDSEEEEDEVVKNAVPRLFLRVKTLLTPTEQMDLTIGLLRRTLIEIFERILGNREGKAILDPCHVVAKASLSDDTWCAAIARPLPPTSPGFGEVSLSTQFVVDFNSDEESFRVVNFLQLLVISKIHTLESKFVVDGEVGSRISWLEEEITIKMVLDQHRAAGDCSPLSLHLLRESQRPLATLSVEITGTQEREDINGKTYTSYGVKVRQNDLVEWTVHKRFSDFVSCHAALQAQSSDQTDYLKHLPRLPARDTLGKARVLESKAALVARRVEGLQTYLNALLAATQENPNAVVLSFLGMLNIKSSAQTPTMHISRLAEEARVGDLVLFRSIYPLSQLQRVATGSDFDHVGIVVHAPRPSSPSPSPSPSHSPCREAGRFAPQPHLLEATGDGVTVLPLVPRLQAYHHFRCCETIVLRRLEQRGAVDEACLEDFLRVAQTRPYKLTLADLAFQPKEIRSVAGAGGVGAASGALGTGTGTGPAAPAPTASESEEDGGKSVEQLFPDLEQRYFFCSALVAAALKSYGVLPASTNEKFFWPGSFQSGKGKAKGSRLFFEAAIEEGFVYGGEMEIDCRELELGRLRPVPPPSNSRPTPIYQQQNDSQITVSAPTATFQPSFF